MVSIRFNWLASLWVYSACAVRLQDLVSKNATVRKVARGMMFSEGPVWLPRESKLVFSDIPRWRLMEWSATGPVRGRLSVFRDAAAPNGQTLDSKGRIITCQHAGRNVVRTEYDGSIHVLCDRYNGQRFNSPNDVVAHSDGSLWFTDPPYGGNPRDMPGNWVFRYDPRDNTIFAVIQDLCAPNGLAFSPDERYLYVADAGRAGLHPNQSLPACHRGDAIIAYHITKGSHLRFAWSVASSCDGMKVDALGNIYTTSPHGIIVLAPNGIVVGTIEVPQPPANCAFGGEDFQTLFITAQTSVYAIRLLNSGADKKLMSIHGEL